MSRAVLDAEQGALLREAAEWRLLALLFERPRPGWSAEVSALADELEAVDLRAAAAAAREAGEGFHLAFLGNGGPVSPREVAHRGFGDPGRILAELQGAYQAFAYRPASEEPLDHVAYEAGFLGYVLLKQAFARARGDERAAHVAREAAGAFRAEHLAYLAEPLAQGLEDCGAGYLALAARALLARTGPRPPQSEPHWTPDCTEGGCALQEPRES